MSELAGKPVQSFRKRNASVSMPLLNVTHTTLRMYHFEEFEELVLQIGDRPIWPASSDKWNAL